MMMSMYRRSFISRFAAVATLFGVGTSAAPAAQPASGERWEPARHPQDDWFDRISGKHRVFFDTTMPAHVEEAVMFAGNFMNANRNAYGLEDRDLAVVIGLRHRATPFAFTDAIWAKYGNAITDRTNFTDPATGRPPTANLYPALTSLVKRGAHLAICDMATHAFSRVIAEKTDGDPDAIYKELVANTLGNAHFVAAGIVAVNRSQERGYSIVYVG